MSRRLFLKSPILMLFNIDLPKWNDKYPSSSLLNSDRSLKSRIAEHLRAEHALLSCSIDPYHWQTRQACSARHSLSNFLGCMIGIRVQMEQSEWPSLCLFLEVCGSEVWAVSADVDWTRIPDEQMTLCLGRSNECILCGRSESVYALVEAVAQCSKPSGKVVMNVRGSLQSKIK